MLRRLILLVIIMGAFTDLISAQDKKDVIQVSGFVFSQEGEDILPRPNVSIAVMNTSRGTVSNENGFFSIVVRKNERLVFSFLGFKSVEYIVPDTVQTDWLTIGQVLELDTLSLPIVEVRPWPSRENFRVEFLAMDVSDELQDRALANLEPYAMQTLMEQLPRSGRETAQIYFNNQTIQSYSAGQLKPMPILNPLAWQKFIKAVKNGDFKRKDK